jgi:hypothetical protein
MIAVSDIFDALGGPTAVARELRINPSTASEMKRRSSIPAEYWAELTAIAQKHRRPEINADLLATLHSRRDAIQVSEPASKAAKSSEPKQSDAMQGHFGRFKHLRRTRFKSSEEISDHIRGLRDEWDRR